MYKTICNYLLYKIFYPLRKRPRRPSRAFSFPPERRKCACAGGGRAGCSAKSLYGAVHLDQELTREMEK